MKIRYPKSRVILASVAVLGAATTSSVLALTNSGASASVRHADHVYEVTASAKTTTPIKHVVVIFDENASFDHYFGTYPDATNTSGEPFYAAPGTPSVTNYNTNPSLLTSNPNGSNPVRLDPSNVNDVLTCDQNHGYTAEENAFDDGKMDKFTAANGTATTTGTSPTGQACVGSTVMDYYDGNAVPGLWNLAQNFAMSDNYFGTGFGPSTPGAINLASGDTGGVDTAHAVRGVLTDGDVIGDGTGGDSVISDAQPYWDDCSTSAALALSGQNVGNLLNLKDLSWGWFQGGFTPTTAYSGPVQTASTYNELNNPNAVTCTTAHNVGAAVGGTGTTGAKAYGTTADYSAHYDPFQFYASTANPHHLAPSSLGVVGTDTATPGEFDTANHNYDVSTFNSLAAAIKKGSMPADRLPAVSYLKAPVYETGHPATSDPEDEQVWLTTEIDTIESLPTWKNTAIFVTYDDSDGWYDQAYSGVTNPSDTSADTLTGTNSCGTVPASTSPQFGTTPLYNEQGRCGYGPRLPLIVISPYAKQNYVSNTLTDQSSILQFIEQNWNLGQIPGSAANVAGSLDDLFNFSAKPAQQAKPLLLSTTTGEPSTPIEGVISPAAGTKAGGTTVTINGLNFALAPGATQVSFGGRSATDVSCAASKTLAAPATTCTAVAPKGVSGQAVPITVTVNDTKATDDAGDYSYN
jgi:phospholipase C